MTTRHLLLGNEALGLGAYVGGATVGTGYPGTPSTEILECFARNPGVYAEWSPNEKVALEVGLGAAQAGARTIVTMKHVGLNVAADPFFAAAYVGVKGGLVVVSADDPGMHSSQGEQDNRNYAKFAKVPLLEPSDSQECLDMMRLALELSEQFDIPVLLRTTGRISHSKSLVEVPETTSPRGSDVTPPRLSFTRRPEKYVMLPGYARQRRVSLEERLVRLREYAESTPLNRVEWGNSHLGIISGSIAYQYAREVFPQASHLKLGMSYPLPARLVLDFARHVDRLVIVEELDPFLEEQIRALPGLPAIPFHGKGVFPSIGELSSEVVARAAVAHGLIAADSVSAALCPEDPGRGGTTPPLQVPTLPPRPPLLCPGCGHRATFYVLRQLMRAAKDEGLVVTGDIGCYTLGALRPLQAMDTCTCMGASIGQAIGIEKAGAVNKVVAVIGDSTFYHSGITGLVDVVTSGAASTVVILDNSTTAMTGGNPNPGTGTGIAGRPARRIELETLCRGLGIQDVQVVDAYNIGEIDANVTRALASPEPSVIIVRAPCALQHRGPRPLVSRVEPERCTGCWTCLMTACPAIVREGGKAVILEERCTGCRVCNQVCTEEAILLLEREGAKP